MQDSPRQPVEMHKLRQPARMRKLLVKGTALFLLIVFGVTHIYQYLGPNAVIWLLGGVGVWLLFGSLLRRSPGRGKRPRRSESSDAFHTDLAVEIDKMDIAEFVRQAVKVLQAQGYDVQPQAEPAMPVGALLLRRGDERAWCTVEDAPVTPPAVDTARAAARQHGCPQTMLLSPHKASAQVELFALQQGVVLIDQDEFIRLCSLQAKGHRVHAFRPRTTNGSDVRRH